MPASNSLPVKNGFTNQDGQQAYPFQLVFSATALSLPVSLDLTQIGLSCVKSVFIDNTNNGEQVTMTLPVVQQILRVGKNMQAIYPAIQFGDKFDAVVTVPTGIGFVNFTLLNFELQHGEWGIGGEVVFSAPQVANYTQALGTIAVGGSTQLLQANGSGNRRMYIQNPSTAAGQGIAVAESLWLYFGNPQINNVLAPPSIEILPGQAWDSGAGIAPFNNVRINAATTGHNFTWFSV